MNAIRSVTLAAVLALAGAAAHARAAPGSGITVYTWTDAAGVTHFSDKPRAHGAVAKLHLPTPPPADQTALAAQRAWLRELDRDWRASEERAAAQRRLETELAARSAGSQPYASQPIPYVPLYAPSRRDHERRHRRHFRRAAQSLPDARFPHDALPSSFPDPLASSFPGLPTSSFPEARAGASAPPHRG